MVADPQRGFKLEPYQKCSRNLSYSEGSISYRPVSWPAFPIIPFIARLSISIKKTFTFFSSVEFTKASERFGCFSVTVEKPKAWHLNPSKYNRSRFSQVRFSAI
jgi:hypothetical protein